MTRYLLLISLQPRSLFRRRLRRGSITISAGLARSPFTARTENSKHIGTKTMLAIIGDSVMWGQGLLPSRKLSASLPQLLAAAHPGLTAKSYAHSGAVIGVGAVPGIADASGEVPVADPTILAQATQLAGLAEPITAVILNGGINDVDIRVIVNPFTTRAHLASLIERYCYQDMLALLEGVQAAVPGEAIPILVVGYYPILNHDSSLDRYPDLLESYALPVGEPFTLLSDEEKAKRWLGSVGNCLTFWHESDACLARAVEKFNRQSVTNRAQFVKLPFAEENAVFASKPWLWGVDATLQPEDEVVHERRDACRVTERGRIARFMCDRASVGHPNVTGAEIMSQRIASAL